MIHNQTQQPKDRSKALFEHGLVLLPGLRRRFAKKIGLSSVIISIEHGFVEKKQTKTIFFSVMIVISIQICRLAID